MELSQPYTYTDFGRLFGATRQKPGYPLQVLGFAHANPVGFPLLSLARRKLNPEQKPKNHPTGTQARRRGGPIPKAILTSLFLLCASILSAQTAAAPKPEDFAGRMSLNAEEGRLMRLELPENVYRHLMRADQGDLRVFDADGIPVPFEIRTAARISETPPPQEVPFFPWTAGDRSPPKQPDIEIDSGGAVVKVYPERMNAPAQTSSYLVDLSGLPYTPESLVLETEQSGKPWNSFVTLQYSEDLSSWQAFGGQQPLAFLGQSESRTNRDTAGLPDGGASYVLLTTGKNTPPLLQVRALFKTITKPETLCETLLPGTKSEDGFSVSYAAQGFFPAAAVDFLLSQADSIDVEILCRYSENDSWLWWDSGTIFRIGSGGETRKNKPWTGNASCPFWKITSRGDVPFVTVPRMVLIWEPHLLVFLARGAGPWILAYGNPDIGPAGNLPRQFQEQETRPASITGDESWQPRPGEPPAGETAWKQWILWGALILAVAVLSAMAYYITKLMRRQG